METHLPWNSRYIWSAQRVRAALTSSRSSGEVEAPALPALPPTAQHDSRSGILTLDKDIDPGHGPLELGGAVEGTAEVASVVGRGSPEDDLAAARPGGVAAAADVHAGVVVLPQLPAHRWGSPASTNHTGFRKNWGFLLAIRSL